MKGMRERERRENIKEVREREREKEGRIERE